MAWLFSMKQMHSIPSYATKKSVQVSSWVGIFSLLTILCQNNGLFRLFSSIRSLLHKTRVASSHRDIMSHILRFHEAHFIRLNFTDARYKQHNLIIEQLHVPAPTNIGATSSNQCSTQLRYRSVLLGSRRGS